MSDIKFVDGAIVKEIDTKYGSMINISIKVEDFKKFIEENQNNGWCNITLATGKSGKKYLKLNTWKPKQENNDEIQGEEGMPF